MYPTSHFVTHLDSRWQYMTSGYKSIIFMKNNQQRHSVPVSITGVAVGPLLFESTLN